MWLKNFIISFANATFDTCQINDLRQILWPNSRPYVSCPKWLTIKTKAACTFHTVIPKRSLPTIVTMQCPCLHYKMSLDNWWQFYYTSGLKKSNKNSYIPPIGNVLMAQQSGTRQPTGCKYKQLSKLLTDTRITTAYYCQTSSITKRTCCAGGLAVPAGPWGHWSSPGDASWDLPLKSHVGCWSTPSLSSTSEPHTRDAGLSHSM